MRFDVKGGTSRVSIEPIAFRTSFVFWTPELEGGSSSRLIHISIPSPSPEPIEGRHSREDRVAPIHRPAATFQGKPTNPPFYTLSLSTFID